MPLADVVMEGGDRTPIGIGELDRVLGGGVVRGSLVLIGGDPGIGKSTLLLQAARALARATPPVLHVSAEESAAQVKLRADRLGIIGEGLLLWPETDLTAVQAEVDTIKPRGVGVVVEAMHLCMIMRGVEKQNSVAVTSCMRGAFRRQQQTRNEFLSLIKKKHEGLG